MANMTQNDAILKTDKLIELLITHQPGLFPNALDRTHTSAQDIAQALADFRRTLIQQLQQQPDLD